MPRHYRTQRATLLAVGEGHSEEAFLKYLRSLYCSGGNGVSVTVRNAYGKGPHNVIEHALRHTMAAAYDRQLCLLDTDIVWPTALIKRAKQKRIILIGANPCLEGMLLDILGNTTPDTSIECKRLLRTITNADMTESSDYDREFTKQVLERSRQRIRALDDLISSFETP